MSDADEEGERPSKRRRLHISAEVQVPAAGPAGPDSQQELSERLRIVIRCVVCLDLPNPNESYQCNRGHIICEECVTRIMAEAKMNRRSAQCPHCRTYISWNNLDKNLIVRQMLAEMPKNCPNCDKVVNFKQLDCHMKNECLKRKVLCKYRYLGCSWHGSYEDSIRHEASCKFLHMSSNQILPFLFKADCVAYCNSEMIRKCFRALSNQKIVYDDLDMRWPTHFFRLNTEVRFKSSIIDALDNSWRVRLKLLTGRGIEWEVTFSIILLTMPSEPVALKYFVTLPASQVQPKQLTDVCPQLQETTFYRNGQSSGFIPLLLNSSNAAYRLLAMPRIILRLWMVMD